MRFTRGAQPVGRLLAALLLTTAPLTSAYTLDPNSTTSVETTAKSMIKNMLSFYDPSTPGLLPAPYYWWEAGAMMGALVDYWYYTKDTEYVNLTQAGLLAQVGENQDYLPRAQNLNEGNDDQGFWGLSVMTAAEYNFPNPPSDQPQWLALAQAVFNTQAYRWDNQHCGGGLRWQIYTWNSGYDYKNSISNACFFALGARLALFTGNHSYADWADKTWNWMEDIKFIDDNYYIYDGAHIEDNCTQITPYQFTYNAGGFILGAAAMYNFTGEQVWKDRLDGLLNGAKVFFTGPEHNIMTEVACESVDRCDLDEQSFKAYLSRWMAAVTKWAPDTYDFVMPYLRASAVAAAKQCVGGDNGEMCGLVWNENKYDGTTGVGQQMAALEVTLACNIREQKAPVTSDTGGTSHGDAGAGSGDIGRITPKGPSYRKLNGGDYFGAAILTVLFIGGFFAGIIWLFLDETSDKKPVEQFQNFRSGVSASLAAFSAAGGVFGLFSRKNDSQDFNEKPSAWADSFGPGGHRGSADDRVIEAAPVHIGHVRTASQTTQQRMSNMPRGWPYNPSLRGSEFIEPDGTGHRRYSVASAAGSRRDISSIHARHKSASAVVRADPLHRTGPVDGERRDSSSERRASTSSDPPVSSSSEAPASSSSDLPASSGSEHAA